MIFAEAILGAFAFALLISLAIAAYLSVHATERDEENELPRYPIHRRLG